MTAAMGGGNAQGEVPLSCFLFVVVAFATVGAILFGLDQGNWAGAIEKPNFIQAFCNDTLPSLDPSREWDCEEPELLPEYYKSFLAWGSSLVQLGAFFGAVILGPPIAGNAGRREAMFVGCFITVMGIIPMCFFTMPGLFMASRFLAGVGVGVVTYALPMFIAEVSPPQIRGTLGSAFQLLMVSGMIFASLLNTQPWFGYRASFSLPIYPAVVMCLGIFCFPQSPRFTLVKAYRQGKQAEGEDEALAALTLLRGSKKAAQTELLDLKKTMESEDEEAPWSTLFRDPSIRRRVLIANSLQWMQQFTGINALLSYGPSMLKAAKLEMDIEVAQFIINVVNLGGTIFMMFAIDRYGRRPLMLAGSSIMMVFMCLSAVIAWQMKAYDRELEALQSPGLNVSAPMLSVGFNMSATTVTGAATLEPPTGPFGIRLGTCLMFCLCGYIMAFGIGWGGVCWVYPSEIFPMDVKEKALSTSVGSQWLANFMVAFIVPYQVGALGLSGTFVFYASCLLCISIAVFFLVPETKGLPMEEMDNLFGPRLGQKERCPSDESQEESEEDEESSS